MRGRGLKRGVDKRGINRGVRWGGGGIKEGRGR